MTDALDLIPLDRATACLWPVSATDGRLHIRILAGDLTAEQRERLAKRHGYATILDPTGSGDARKFFEGHGRAEGWADGMEITRELAKLDCDIGRSMRATASQVRA